MHVRIAVSSTLFRIFKTATDCSIMILEFLLKAVIFLCFLLLPDIHVIDKMLEW